MQVGDTIHILGSTSDDPSLCIPAIVGGKIGGHWWLLALQFNGSRITWLNDERWHPKRGCTTPSGKAQDAPSRNTEVRPE